MKVVDKALYNDNSTVTNQTLIYGENTNVYGSTMTDRKPLAYGRITITDLTNIGKLSAYLVSSQPLMVVYDPNDTNGYMPNWETSNLIITPVVFFNNDQVSLTSEQIEITWKRKAGSGQISDLIDGEKVVNGTLVVSQNMLSNISEGLITYSCSIKYTDVLSNSALQTQTQLTYSLVKNAVAGENATILQIMIAENSSSIILNDKNNVVLEAQLSDGTSVVTSDVTYQWSKFEGSSYENILDATSNTLTVMPSMVDSVASFKCTATYNDNQYIAFYSVVDKSDPIEIKCFSTLGEQIINGSGVGAIYALAFRNGEEIDAIKTTSFGADYPSNPSAGMFFYKINTTNKTVSLIKYNGTSWVSPTSGELPTAQYSWYRRDSAGKELDTSKPYATGKVIYLDSSIINKKINFTCKCEI